MEEFGETDGTTGKKCRKSATQKPATASTGRPLGRDRHLRTLDEQRNFHGRPRRRGFSNAIFRSPSIIISSINPTGARLTPNLSRGLCDPLAGGGRSWFLGPIELQEVMRRRRREQGRGSPCCRVGFRVNGGRLLVCHLQDDRQQTSSGLASPSLQHAMGRIRTLEDSEVRVLSWSSKHPGAPCASCDSTRRP